MPVPQRQLGWTGTLHSGGAGEWMDIGAVWGGKSWLVLLWLFLPVGSLAR